MKTVDIKIKCRECDKEIGKYATFYNIENRIMCEECVRLNLTTAYPVPVCIICDEIIDSGEMLDLIVSGKQKFICDTCLHGLKKENDPIKLKEEHEL